MSEKKRDVIFRRVRGRVIPIRVKRREDIKGASKIGAASLVGFTSAKVAANQLRKSEKAFNKAALLRGTRRLSKPGSARSRELAGKAINFARKGGRATGKGRFLLFGGSLAVAALTSSGVGDILATRTDETTKEATQTFTSIAAGLGTVALFSKIGRVRGFKTSIKRALKSGSPDEQIAEAFGAFEQKGRKRTSELIKKFERAKFKGGPKKGEQLKLFNENKPKQTFSIAKFIKGLD